MYEKPGLIINKHLLDGVNLVPGLQENYDFVAVCLEVWLHLHAWYGSDHKVCRRMVRDTSSSKSCWRLDLYPEHRYTKVCYGRPPRSVTLADERLLTQEF